MRRNRKYFLPNFRDWAWWDHFKLLSKKDSGNRCFREANTICVVLKMFSCRMTLMEKWLSWELKPWRTTRRPMTWNYHCTYSRIWSQSKHILIFLGLEVKYHRYAGWSFILFSLKIPFLAKWLTQCLAHSKLNVSSDIINFIALIILTQKLW